MYFFKTNVKPPFCFGAEVWNPSTTVWRNNWKLVMVWPASCTARCHTEWAIGLQIPFKALWITVPFKWGHLPLSQSHHDHWCVVRGMKKRGQTKGLYRWRLLHSHLHVDSLKLSLRGHKIEQINHYLQVAVLVGCDWCRADTHIFNCLGEPETFLCNYVKRCGFSPLTFDPLSSNQALVVSWRLAWVVWMCALILNLSGDVTTCQIRSL